MTSPVIAREMIEGMSDDTNPFKGKIVDIPAPMTVLHRFTKPGRVAEIRERTVTQWTKAIEFLVYVDGHFHESWKFHGERLPEYPRELAKRCEWFRQDGWTEEAETGPTRN